MKQIAPSADALRREYLSQRPTHTITAENRKFSLKAQRLTTELSLNRISMRLKLRRVLGMSVKDQCPTDLCQLNITRCAGAHYKLPLGRLSHRHRKSTR